MRSNNNIRMALASINAMKWRSFLTMLGVVIGVLSVVTVVSLGEGVKHQLTGQIKHTGADLITVRGGQVAKRDSHGQIGKVNLLSLFGGTNLTEADYQTVQKVPDLELVAPFAVIPGVAKTDDGNSDPSTIIVAVNAQGARALNQDMPYGTFFTSQDNKRPMAVVGKRVAENLFRENAPVGKTFELRGRQFAVQGVFESFEASPLTPGLDYNNTIFIPYEYAKELLGVPLQPYQILVRPAKGVAPVSAADHVSQALLAAHGGQADFTVLKAGDATDIASSLLTLLTNLVSAIAAVSLLVGGIGIMNIMLVAVSERTHEIGVRKSLGATNRQILNQFLTEAMVLSGAGGILGVLASLLANYLLRIFTDLQPVITLPIIGLAVVVAVGVGIIFGIMPALKAAHKDPIEALRRI